jgi:hypothetical protein
MEQYHRGVGQGAQENGTDAAWLKDEEKDER